MEAFYPLPLSLVDYGELQLLAKKSDFLYLIYNGTIAEFPSCNVHGRREGKEFTEYAKDPRNIPVFL